MTGPRRWRNNSPEKHANFLLSDMVKVELVVQAQALSSGTYGDSRNDRDLVSASDRGPNVDGLLIFDDMWMPAIQKVAAFIRTNISGYQELPTPVKNVFCVKKTKEDDRPWDHFAAF